MSGSRTVQARTRVRALWRRLRDLPFVGVAVRLGDRILWAREITRSGLVDVPFYAAQRGWKHGGLRRATWDYVFRGFRHGLSPNPLFDELVAGRGLPESHRVPALYAYLVSDRRTVAVHPWWDAPADAVDGRVAPLDFAWAHRDTTEVALAVAGRRLTVPVAQLRAWSIDAARGWRRRDMRPLAGDRGDVVVRMLQHRDRDYPRRVATAATLTETNAVVVAAVGCEVGQWVAMDVASRLFPGLTWRHFDRSVSYGAAVNACFVARHADEGTVCVIGPRSDLDVEDVRRLQESVRRGRAVAPIEVAADGTIAAVGAAGTGGTLPYRILAGHPVEDLEGIADRLLEVPLLIGPTFAIATADLSAAGALSRPHPAPVAALCAALRHENAEFSCVVDPRVRSTAYAPQEIFTRDERATITFADDRAAATSILERAGFEVHGWSPPTYRSRAGSGLEPELRWRRPDPSMLRWAVKISAPPGPQGAVWGDTHFADGLAKALRRHGQFVAVDSFDARARPSSYLDDVTLVVRGPYRIDAPTSGLSVEWIISHPDQITAEEVGGFDLVYAASDRWSAAASDRWGMPVEPLLECTDVDQFHPRGVERTDEIVFVGTARGIARPSVVAPLAAGIPVRVYGPDWRTFIPASAIVAESIPNSELSARYESASVVLNDQWPAMRREGFIAMRPFDAVAAGGRVVSEYVDGIEAVFGDAVVTFRTEAELVALLQRDPDEIFPDQAALAAASERIRRDHSFDARAAQILAAVRERREQSVRRGVGR